MRQYLKDQLVQAKKKNSETSEIRRVAEKICQSTERSDILRMIIYIGCFLESGKESSEMRSAMVELGESSEAVERQMGSLKDLMAKYTHKKMNSIIVCSGFQLIFQAMAAMFSEQQIPKYIEEKMKGAKHKIAIERTLKRLQNAMGLVTPVLRNV